VRVRLVIPSLFVAASAMSVRPPPARAGIDLRIICTPCETAEDCGDHTDLCLVYPGVGNFCGMHCLTDDDCFGLSCQRTEFEGVDNCVDVEGYCRGGPPFECSRDEHCGAGETCDAGQCIAAGADLGAPCEIDDDCRTGFCRATARGTLCTTPCEWLDPAGAGCPDGFYCDEAQGCGDGVCVPGTAGERGPGAACDEDVDCAGLLCFAPAGARLCAEPCDPAAPTCADGAYCAPRGVGCGGCVEGCVAGGCGPLERCADGQCVPLLPDGAACSDPDECSSGLCRAGSCGNEPDAGGTGPSSDGGVGAGQLTSGCECTAAPSPTPGAANALLRLLTVVTLRLH
jgi:Cys-rich repeat protein